MPLRIVDRQNELNNGDKAFIEKRINKLRKLVRDISVLDVIVDLVRHSYRVQLTLKAGRITLNAEGEDKQVRKAFDVTLAKLERALKRSLEKMRGNKKHARINPRVQSAEFTVTAEIPAEDTLSSSIISVEQVTLKPMSVEEAAEQIDVNGRTLLVFVNDDSERVNVLYKREDGHYSLIQPT